MQVQSLGVEEGMATHSSILAWRIPWTEEPGRPQSTGSQRAGHDWRNLAHLHSIDISIITAQFSTMFPEFLNTPFLCPVSLTATLWGQWHQDLRRKRRAPKGGSVPRVSQLTRSHRRIWTQTFWVLDLLGLWRKSQVEKINQNPPKFSWPASWETCMQVRNQQLELDMEQTDWFQIGKEYFKAAYCHRAYLTYRVHPEKCWAGRSTRWNQDCWEKYQ